MNCIFIFQGYCEVRTLCANVFVMKVFEEDPTIILSIMVGITDITYYDVIM